MSNVIPLRRVTAPPRPPMGPLRRGLLLAYKAMGLISLLAFTLCGLGMLIAAWLCGLAFMLAIQIGFICARHPDITALIEASGIIRGFGKKE